MKKILCVLTALLLTLTFLGCTAEHPAETTDTAVCIGEDQALALAMAQAERIEESTDALYNVLTELDAENVFYAVSFESDTAFYEYDIDAVSGKILRGKRKGKPQTMAPVTLIVPNETTAPTE